MYDPKKSSFFSEAKLDSGTENICKYLKKQTKYFALEEKEFIIGYEAGPTGFGLQRRFQLLCHAGAGIKKTGRPEPEVIAYADKGTKRIKAKQRIWKEIGRIQMYPKGTLMLHMGNDDMQHCLTYIKEKYCYSKGSIDKGSANEKRSHHIRYVMNTIKKSLLFSHYNACFIKTN